jgi:hypothetical protein
MRSGIPVSGDSLMCVSPCISRMVSRRGNASVASERQAVIRRASPLIEKLDGYHRVFTLGFRVLCPLAANSYRPLDHPG